MTETPAFSPHTINDPTGIPQSVLLSYSEYRMLLRLLAYYADWDELPEQFQDAIDTVLADDAESESRESTEADVILRPLETEISEPQRTVASLYGAWANVEITDEDFTEARLKLPDNPE